MATSWWAMELWQVNKILLIGWVFWTILSICLHELGHGIAAIQCGDNTPRELGHMNLNPFVHMGAPALIAFAILGMTWGQMPVDPSRFRRSWHDAWVSFAGPLVNLLLALVCIVAAGLWIIFASNIQNQTLYDNTQVFFKAGAAVNMVMFIFNLIPAPPLDGSTILATFVRSYRELLQKLDGGFGGMIMLIIAVVLLGRIVFGFGLEVAIRSIEWLVHVLQPLVSP